MTTLREKALPLFAKARGPLIDQKAGLRRYRVFVRTRTPADGVGDLDTTWTVVDVELTEKPRVRRASTKDEIRSGGRVRAGQYMLDRITPRNDGNTIGTTFDTIYPKPTSPGQKVSIVLVNASPGSDADILPYTAADPAHVPPIQPSGGSEFTPVMGDATKNFEFTVFLEPWTGSR